MLQAELAAGLERALGAFVALSAFLPPMQFLQDVVRCEVVMFADAHVGSPSGAG